ncbi:hypothetical protein V502_08980 [Pseudogymnoascus sp. VKM F-4520 (FW-2644)]|nr:hypothetical protein V502_08980 [Pseudogymnoascus sp. VKM F-4520 (FW-2644)]
MTRNACGGLKIEHAFLKTLPPEEAVIYSEGISHLRYKIWSRPRQLCNGTNSWWEKSCEKLFIYRASFAKALYGLAFIAASFVIVQLYHAPKLPCRDSSDRMGASTRPNNSDGAYAPVDTPGDQRSPGGHTTAATNQARPHPAFVTDEGPAPFIDTLGSILIRRAPAVRMICYIGAVLLTTDFLTVGLAANASSNIGPTDTESAVDPAGVFLNTVAGFAEVTLFAILSFCFLFWNWHLAYFISIGLIGLSALGTGAYGMAIMAISMRNSCSLLPSACVLVLFQGPKGSYESQSGVSEAASDAATTTR